MILGPEYPGTFQNLPRMSWNLLLHSDSTRLHPTPL